MSDGIRTDHQGDRASRLPDLIALAREHSSEKRRELLRELTDHFFGAVSHPDAEVELYGDVIARLSADMESAVRVELAQRFSDRLNAPRSLMRLFAGEEIAVAGPILRSSPVLTDDDLLTVVRHQGQGHLRAVSQRAVVSEAVADVIVERSDDQTLQALLENDGAALSRQASESAVERAKLNPDLHAATVDRKSLPPDLLNEMYFLVEIELRRRIVARNASMDSSLLENALAAGMARVATEDGVWPPDYVESLALVTEIKGPHKLSSGMIARILRSGNPTAFRIAVAEVSEVDFYTVSRIMDRREVDPLAVICRAADLDPALFMTIALSIIGSGEHAVTQARGYSVHYAELTRDAALRTLRFWRLRRGMM